MIAIKRVLNNLTYPYWAYLRSGRHTDDVLATIDHDAFKSLQKYKLKTHNNHYAKYLNMNYWMRMNVVRALSLGLEKKTGTPLHILDVGSGFGYFPYVARFYNHRVVGIDLPDDILFEKAAEFLELDIKPFMIQAQKPLGKFSDEKYDLITAFQVCFNGHKTQDLWGVKDWTFFLDDLFENHMNKGGALYMELNYEPAIEGWLPDDVIDLFNEKYNAKFNGFSRVTLKTS